MSDVVIRPATIEDYSAFYPHDPLTDTIRAWAVDYHGKLACIAGVIRVNPYDLLAFSDIMPGIEAPKATVWKTARQLFENIKGLGLDIIADPDCNIGRAPVFLRRLGFHEINGGLYKWLS